MGNTTTINTLAETRTIETVCVPLVAGIANRTEKFAGSHQEVSKIVFISFVSRNQAMKKENFVKLNREKDREGNRHRSK